MNHCFNPLMFLRNLVLKTAISCAVLAIIAVNDTTSVQAETSKTPLFALQCGGSALQISIDELETVRARFATALKVRGINPEASDFFSENFFAQVSCKLKNGFGGQNLTEGQLEKVDILELLINAPRSRGKSEAVLDILELLQQTKDQQKTK